MTRTWFMNDARSELIQVQPDRFLRNWRRIEVDDAYPRYAHVRQRFVEGVGDFRDFLKSENLGAFRPNQCEISYINHIETSHIWNTHSEIEKVLRLWNPRVDTDHVPSLENVRVATQHVMRDRSEAPIGRLHVATQPAFRGTEAEPLIVFSLTARGAPSEPTMEGVMEFVDKGRETIVRGFTSMTTVEMHRHWGRTR